jgi:hypothetical protein
MGVVLEYMFRSCAWFPFGCDRVWLEVRMVGQGHFVVVIWFVFQVSVGFGARVWCAF